MGYRVTEVVSMSHITNILYTLWHFIFNLLSTNGHELDQYGTVALFATLVASFITIAIMLYIKPQRRLDKAFFLRELGITSVLSVAFIARFFHWFSQPWLVFGYTILFVASVGIIVELLIDHFSKE